VESLGERIVVGGDVQLERPVERVVGDDGKDLASLHEEGRQGGDPFANAAVAHDRRSRRRKFAEEEAEVLQCPRMHEPRPRTDHLDAGHSLQGIREHRVAWRRIEHDRLVERGLVAEPTGRGRAHGFAALVR
jgi:hypothetical protein